MRPFSPLIKLLIFPVYRELRETIEILDRTNKRLDALNTHVQQDVAVAIDGIHIKIDQQIQRLDKRVRKAEQAMEYVKLLHTLSHNIVVELTKLKIEEENLKIKARILEKDFEFLGKREKALEKHVFK